MVDELKKSFIRKIKHKSVINIGYRDWEAMHFKKFDRRFVCCNLHFQKSSGIIWNALLHNVYHRLTRYFSYKTSMAQEQESLWLRKASSWISDTKGKQFENHSRYRVNRGSFLGPRWSLSEKAMVEHKGHWFWPKKQKKNWRFAFPRVKQASSTTSPWNGNVGIHWTNFRLKENLTIANNRAITDLTNEG